jgi:DNA-binding LacI/PurR family transcriptional regulator
VILDRPIVGIPTCVSSDQDQAAAILCSSLTQAGVKTVALVCGPRHIVTHRRRCERVAERFRVLACHEGPAQRETGRQALAEFRDLHPDAIVCTNNFLGQGVLEAVGPSDRFPILACFDEIPMMEFLPVPTVCSVQDVPMLAEGCVQLLLPQLTGEAHQLEPLVLPTRMMSNRTFQSLLVERAAMVGHF